MAFNNSNLAFTVALVVELGRNVRSLRVSRTPLKCIEIVTHLNLRLSELGKLFCSWVCLLGYFGLVFVCLFCVCTKNRRVESPNCNILRDVRNKLSLDSILILFIYQIHNSFTTCSMIIPSFKFLQLKKNLNTLSSLCAYCLDLWGGHQSTGRSVVLAVAFFISSSLPSLPLCSRAPALRLFSSVSLFPTW